MRSWLGLQVLIAEKIKDTVEGLLNAHTNPNAVKYPILSEAKWTSSEFTSPTDYKRGELFRGTSRNTTVRKFQFGRD